MYLKLLRINLKNVYDRDKAYFGNNWSNVLSTIMYTATQLIFIELLFNRIDSIAGYTQNDMYFLTFVGQIAFYIIVATQFTPLTILAEKVNRGLLDYYLLRPVPRVWHMFTSHISILYLTRDAVPPMIPLVILINWQELSISPASAILGIATLTAGLGLVFCMMLNLLTLYIRTGSGSPFIANFYWAASAENKVPFGPLYNWFKVLVFVALPMFVPSALATAVFINAVPGLFWVAVSFCALGLMGLATYANWQNTLKLYTSASS